MIRLLMFMLTAFSFFVMLAYAPAFLAVFLLGMLWKARQ